MYFTFSSTRTFQNWSIQSGVMDLMHTVWFWESKKAQLSFLFTRCMHLCHSKRRNKLILFSQLKTSLQLSSFHWASTSNKIHYQWKQDYCIIEPFFFLNYSNIPHFIAVWIDTFHESKKPLFFFLLQRWPAKNKYLLGWGFFISDRGGFIWKLLKFHFYPKMTCSFFPWTSHLIYFRCWNSLSHNNNNKTKLRIRNTLTSLIWMENRSLRTTDCVISSFPLLKKSTTDQKKTKLLKHV